MARDIPLTDAVRALREFGGPATRKVVAETNREISKDAKTEISAAWRRQRIKPSVANSVIGRSATQRKAVIKLRYSRFPYAAGVEWGSHQYRQFRPWVGNQFTASGPVKGYVVGDTLNRIQDDLLATWADRFLDAVDRKL